MSEARLKNKVLIKQVKELQLTLAQALRTHGAYLAAVGDFSDTFKAAMQARIPQGQRTLAEVFDAAHATAATLIAEGLDPFATPPAAKSEPEVPLVTLK